MANVFWKFFKGINIEPQSGTAAAVEGDVAYRDDVKKLEVHDGTSADNIVQENKAATLANKTLTAPIITGDSTHNGNVVIVAGDLKMDNAKHVQMKNFSGTYQNVVGINVSDDIEIGGSANGGVHIFSNSGNRRITVAVSGNVGINNVAPAATLDVGGNIISSGTVSATTVTATTINGIIDGGTF